MTTHIERFKALVEAVSGYPATEERLDRISKDFVMYRRDQIEAEGFDPGTLTRAQRASVVLDAYAHHGNSVGAAMLKRRITNIIKQQAAVRDGDL